LIRSTAFSAFLFSGNDTMDNFGKEILADIFPPTNRRENIGLCITGKGINSHTLPDMGNHRQSSTLQ